MIASSLGSVTSKRVAAMVCISIAMLLTAIQTSNAAAHIIVCMGTSTTRGRGVSAAESYPGQLQAALRAKGHNVQVINMGVNGDSSAGMLKRVGSVPKGTELVLLEIWPNQEARDGVTNTDANRAAIHAQLEARNIKVIDMTNTVVTERKTANKAGELVDTKAGPHMSAGAYSSIVADVLPQVEAVIGQ